MAVIKFPHMDRREFAIGLISTVVVGVSGCTFGRQDRRSLSIENRGSRDHVVVIELRSSYGDQPGQTEYFSQEFTISSDEATAYDDAVAVSDGPPRHMWIRVSIDV